jgi:hypothetical protein
LDLFSGKYDDRIIWVTKNAFVFLRWNHQESIPADHAEHGFDLTLTVTDKCHYLSINSSTLEESILCLDYLVGLKDIHFEKMGISYIHHDEDEWEDHEETPLCPFVLTLWRKCFKI